MKETDKVQKLVRVGQLLDLYGELLTDRQREFTRLHYTEDLSFGEIGRLNNVSRQAVHDAVRHALNIMNEYEDKLGLLKSGALEPDTAMKRIHSALPELETLVDSVKKQGVIYNTRPVLHKLKHIIEILSSNGQPRAGVEDYESD